MSELAACPIDFEAVWPSCPVGRFAELSKRTFDLIVAGMALILLAPVFVVIALLIKLDSRGPIFFGQVRVGRERRLFRMLKFRKMYHDMPEQGPNLTRQGDDRLTRLGRLLERTKLDELPQFMNVLVGDMSIIGPRPEIPLFVAHYPEQWDRVLSVKPGIFGPCQIRYRKESELYPPACTNVEGYYIQHILPQKLAIDADYASQSSLTGDAVMLVGAVMTCLGDVFKG
jgi:lipopolysaccharide/colanic/teichoic acid biosynthesis glycosyltransferase